MRDELLVVAEGAVVQAALDDAAAQVQEIRFEELGQLAGEEGAKNLRALIVGDGADLGEFLESRELGGGQADLGRGFNEDRDMALMRLAQKEADVTL